MPERLRLGVSACLLGERVRYDGQHKLDHFITDTLGKYVEYVPVCPEVECGLSVPREAMRLVGCIGAPRLLTQHTGRDLTDQMLSWALRSVIELEKENLCGFIFKSKSPSSGMERVKVYNGQGEVCGRGPGMFANEFMRHFPLLPVEDEGRLQDPELRENFVERIFTLKRYRETTDGEATLAALMEFHQRHKLLIQAHSPEMSRAMGRMLASAREQEAAAVCGEYEARLLGALRLIATPAKHANVLQHMLGYLRNLLTSEEKKELLLLIDGVRTGLLPLIVPITMFSHYVRKYDVTYLRGQAYLASHPLELKLRNHA